MANFAVFVKTLSNSTNFYLTYNRREPRQLTSGMNVCVRKYCEGMGKFNSAPLNVLKDWFPPVFIRFGDFSVQNTERIVLFGGRETQLTRPRGWFSNCGNL